MNAEMKTQIEQRERILARVRGMLIEHLHVRREPSEIDPDCPLFGSGLGLDSVDAVELVVALGDEFNLQIKEAAKVRTSMRTVNTVVDLIQATLEGRHDH